MFFTYCFQHLHDILILYQHISCFSAQNIYSIPCFSLCSNEQPSLIYGLEHKTLQASLLLLPYLWQIPANRRMSSESGLSSSQNLRRNNSKSSRRTLRPSDSVASSIGSNLNRVGGAQDLTKVYDYVNSVDSILEVYEFSHMHMVICQITF